MPVPADELDKILTPTDKLSINVSGDLMIEGCVADDLLEKFGSPLYVVSEATLRENYRRISRAFSSLWPKQVNVLYAIKANNNLAVRAIMNQEGAGGDCFGLGELYATLAGGADPSKVVLNGSNKSPALLLEAVKRGITINIDAEDEVGLILDLTAELKTTARVKMRLKVYSDEFNSIATDYFGGNRLADYVRRVKWGFSPDTAEPLVRKILSNPRMEFLGYHFHIGRTSRDIHFNRLWANALGQIVSALFEKTGFSPRILNVGGGWPRERDPESRSFELNPTTIEEYASATCSALLETLQSAGLSIPELWLEPGRYIVGNAVLFLARVGAIKHDLGMTWVNLDASTNNLMRIDTSQSAYHVFPATGMQRPATERVVMVGETCIDSIFSADCRMPVLQRGESVAILDAGMYAETGSTQLNGIPRPATILVNGNQAEIIKERETVEDVFSKHCIPPRLL